MKFFLVILPGLLVFDSLQGSTLPQGRPTRALNTTLRTNFSGIYQRKNPCSGSEVETSSYKASHELHHHTKDDGWCDYTHKCSAIIRNFLQTIGNLIKFNHDPSGSFNFYLNTSISQKQRLTGDPNSCESLPTIVIEATDCKIPINSCCQIPRGENVKYKSDRKYSTDQFPDEGILPPDFSGQEDCKTQEAVPISDTMVTPQSAAYYPGRDWFKAEKSSHEDDNYKFPIGFTSSTAEDLSPAARYEKPKIFKTSLKLTPQADPENGTIKPRIHYMAANLVADPSLTEPAPQSETESPFLQPGSPGLLPVPFPEGPNHPTIAPSPPLVYPPQVPQPTVAPAFQPFANQNEPVQLSVTGQPEPQFSLSSSPREKLAQTAAAPNGEPFSTPADLPVPTRLSNGPSGSITLEDLTAVNRINDPQSSFDPLRSQSATTTNHDPNIPNVQSTSAPQFFDNPPRPAPLNSRSDLTVSSEGQAQPNFLQLPRQRPQEDMPSQVSQPAVDFPGRSPKVNGEALNYPTTLNRTPTVGDLSIEPKPQTFAPKFANQIIPPVPRDGQFNAQQISSPHQRFPGQLPYDNRLPSTVLPPRDSFRTFEGPSLTTPLPPLQSGFNEVPNYSSLVPGESKEESNDGSIPLASQPPVTPYLARIPVNGLPYSDSLITSPPGLDGTVEPTDSYLGQQPTSDGQSAKRFHSTSVTTTVQEETVTSDQKQTTPGFALDSTAEQLPGSTSNNFNPSPSGSDPSSIKAPQQFPSVLTNYPQPQLPGPGPFKNSDMEYDNHPPVNPTPEDSKKFSTIDSKITNVISNPNNDQILPVPETSQTVPVPFRQESQLPEPEYDPSTNGLLAMTTPMPFAPNPPKTTLNSPITPEGKPSTAVAIYPEAGPTMAVPTRQYPPGEYNFQVPSQQVHSTPEPVPAGEPLVAYSEQADIRAPPVSDSLVRSDYLTTAAPQPLNDNVNGITSIPDNSLTYGTATVNQFTISPQQNQPLMNPENSTPAADLHKVRSGTQITEVVPSYLPTTVTPPPEVYAPLQEQQPLGLTSHGRFQEPLPSSEQFSTEQISRLSSAVTESPEVVLAQEQFGNGQNQGRNQENVYTVTTADTERNFQTSLPSTTPIYATQSPIEADSKQIFQPQTENKYGGRIPKNPLGPLKLSDGKQTTDSAMSLQALSSDSFPESSIPSDQYPPTLPSPNTFPEYVDATTPAGFPPAAGRLSQEFPLNRFSAFVSPLPAGQPASEITPGNPDFRQSQNSQQFSSFNSQQPSPGLPADTSKPQLPAIPLAGLPLSPAPKSQYQNDNFDQAPPVNSVMATSIKDLSADTLPTTPPDAYAFPLPQNAGTTLSTDSPREYTLPPILQSGENQFFTSSTPQPSPPVQKFDRSTQTTLQQPSDLVLPSSVISQSQNSDLVLKAPLEAPQLSFDQPILFETNTVQPPTSLSVGPAFATIPPPAQPGATSPQPTFNPQSADSAPNQQEIVAFGRREESRPNDLGQNINNLPVAAVSSSLPQPHSYRKTTIEETTTTTSVQDSNQFSTGSTEAPFLEPLQTLPESAPAGETMNTQQQSFLSPDSQQLPNYSDQRSDESSSSFAPLVSHQISTPSIPTPADRSSAAFQQQMESLDFSTNNRLSSTTPAPEMVLTYPDRPTSSDSGENVHSVVSDSVESLSSQQESQREVDPVHFSSVPPPALNPESQTLSQANSNFQETSSAVNLQRRPYGSYGQPPPGPFNAPMANSYSGNLPTLPGGPLPGGYPAPNYMRPPLSDSENRPPFYGQHPSLNSSQKPESTVQQVIESENTTQSSGPQTQPGLPQPGVPFNPGNFPPAYFHNQPNPNGPMPPFNPNYNAFQPQDRYRYFAPQNYDPRLRFPNQQHFQPYPNQRPVSQPMNQIINNRQIINPRQNYPFIRPDFPAQPGREVPFRDQGPTFRHQTEDRPTVDSPRPETASRPVGQPSPAQENNLQNPLLQALQSHLVVPTQEDPQQHTSFPGRSHHNEQLSFDTKNATQIDNAGRWNPRTATNFVNLHQNTALDALRGVPNGPQAPVPDQTAPSNEPGLRQSELKMSKAVQEGIQDGSPLQKLQDRFKKDLKMT